MLNFGRSIIKTTIKGYDMRSMDFLKIILIFNVIGLQPIFNQVISSSSDTIIYFNEVNGLVIAEIESLPPAEGWVEKTDKVGFTGTSFFEWTSDNKFNAPGNGLMNYTVKINSPGTYRFQWHCKVGHGSKTTESNDSWLRIPEAAKFYAIKNTPGADTVYPKGVCTANCPEGSGKDGWFKAYSSTTTNWTWNTFTFDGNSHEIYARFDKAGFYKIQISGRSTHHLIDRFILYKNNVSTPTNLSKKETKVSYAPNNKVKAKFKIQSKQTKGIISGATISLDGTMRTTDNAGTAFYYNLPINTDIPVKITKETYLDLNKKINITRDTTINLYLIEVTDTLPDITFEVTNKEKISINAAQIKIGGKSKNTATSGKITFTDMPKNSLLSYEITRSGYLKVENSIKTTNDTTIKVTLIHNNSSVDINNNTNQVLVHPNPASSVLFVRAPDIINSLSIIDLSGKTVFKKTNIDNNILNLDVRGFNSGMYILKIDTFANHNIYNKFIKK